MNLTNDELQELLEVVARGSEAQRQRAVFGRQALAATERLAKACYGHDNSQAEIVVQCLASIYNGQDAARVRLDEIRWLDWELQRDLVTVILGTGQEKFQDVDIARAFHAIDGDAAVKWFHTRLKRVE